MDTKFDKLDSRITEVKEEIIHQFRIIAQDWIDRLDQLYLDVVELNAKFDRTFDEIHKIHEETRQEISVFTRSLVNRTKNGKNFRD